MLLLAGSALVKDSEGMHDLDIIYLTPNVGKYLLLLMLKDDIEKRLSAKFNIDIAFSPYLLTSPTIVGNLFLAITLLRYPYSKGIMRYLTKLTLARQDRRWFTLHTAFAILGLVSSESHRDYRKYCSMLAENLLCRYKVRIPGTWDETVRLGYALSAKLKLRHVSSFLLSCIKGKLNSVDEELLKYVAEELNEVNGDVTSVAKPGLSNVLRRIHEVLMKVLLKRKVKWIECSFIMLVLVTPKVLGKVLKDPRIRNSLPSVFNTCKDNIPVLSPLAHP